MQREGNTNPSPLAKPIHLARFFTVEQIVVVLHGDKFGPTLLLRQSWRHLTRSLGVHIHLVFGDGLQLCQFKGPHRRCADIANFPGHH